MKRSYITFGQDHRHEVNGEIFDKDCVALIEHETDPREVAFELFGREWSMEYPEKYFDMASMKHFPRGIIKL